MKYRVMRTDRAQDQIRNIIMYIAEESGSRKTALRYLDKLEKAVLSLGDFTYIGPEPRYSILRNQGYRVLVVGKHLVFYKVNEEEKVVMIYAVVGSRKEYRHLL